MGPRGHHSLPVALVRRLSSSRRTPCTVAAKHRWRRFPPRAVKTNFRRR